MKPFTLAVLFIAGVAVGQIVPKVITRSVVKANLATFSPLADGGVVATCAGEATAANGTESKPLDLREELTGARLAAGAAALDSCRKSFVRQEGMGDAGDPSAVAK